MTNANTGRGSFAMYDHFAPGIAPGRYELHVTSAIEPPREAETAGSDFHREEQSIPFTVIAPRFFLQVSKEIRSCFPPHGGSADYEWILPNIVLERRALPWERSTRDPSRPTNPLPWLALVVVTHDEMRQDGATVQLLPKDRMVTPTREDALVYAPWLDSRQRASWVVENSDIVGLGDEDEKQPIMVLDMSAELFRSLCPKTTELALLAHVRQVDVSAKQDDDARGNGDFAILVANRFVQSGINTVFLVSIEGWTPWLNDPQYALDKPRVQAIVLHSWNFEHTTGDGSFRQAVQDLQVGMLMDHRVNLPGTAMLLSAMLAQGYTPIAYQPRGAARTFAWYRGPLVPVRVPLFADDSIVFNTADEALIVDTATAMADISYSSAWQLGRLLALTSASFGRALLHWNQVKQAGVSTNAGAPRSIAEEMTDYLMHHALSKTQSADIISGIAVVTEWLGELLLLQRIPARYLLPSAALLPPESLRFFYVDDNWLDALVEGALSIGATSLSSETFRGSTRNGIRAAVRQMMVLQSQKRRSANLSSEQRELIEHSAPLCGFLLRSSIVTRFPGLEIELVGPTANAAPTLLRMETIGHELLLVLVLGQTLQSVIFKVPREGLAYRANQARLTPRITDVRAAEFGTRRSDGSTYSVDTRHDGAAGVIDIAGLAAKLEASTNGSSAKFALHWLNGPDDVQIRWIHDQDDSPAVTP